jgi:hypothetical protein
MRRMPFRAPTDYYCESLEPIDEQICELLGKRKELSNNNPGFPDLEKIASWCQENGLNEDLIRSIFASLYHEPYFLPIVEPTEFLKFVSVLKSAKINGIMFAVTYMKQYQNASVVYIEAENDTNETNARLEHTHFELFISPDYNCRPDGGIGHNNGIQRSFVVTPPLTDDLAGVEFRLTVKPHREEVHPMALYEFSVTIK